MEFSRVHVRSLYHGLAGRQQRAAERRPVRSGRLCLLCHPVPGAYRAGHAHVGGVSAFGALLCCGLHHVRRQKSRKARTLTMMGGPIDTRETPTVVDRLATERPLSWFERNVVATVPFSYPGAGRKVYPGFMQLAGFMSMNLGNHLMSHWEMFRHLVQGDDESADATKDFYEEYRSVCDMTAEFYLQTVREVFQEHSLPRGVFEHRGRQVDPAAITDVGLLAVEGERDDISGLGQTKAALTIATHLPEELKRYYMAEGVGHYGIFNGSKWRTRIAPVVEEWIALHDA